MRENSSRNQGGLKYQKLYNWGRTLIMSGVLRNMDKFPSENMLQNKFGYSRQTVRNALDRLEQDGLIARVKGSGTYVSYAPEKDKEERPRIGFSVIFQITCFRRCTRESSPSCGRKVMRSAFRSRVTA